MNTTLGTRLFRNTSGAMANHHRTGQTSRTNLIHVSLIYHTNSMVDAKDTRVKGCHMSLNIQVRATRTLSFIVGMAQLRQATTKTISTRSRTFSLIILGHYARTNSSIINTNNFLINSRPNCFSRHTMIKATHHTLFRIRRQHRRRRHRSRMGRNRRLRRGPPTPQTALLLSANRRDLFRRLPTLNIAFDTHPLEHFPFINRTVRPDGGMLDLAGPNVRFKGVVSHRPQLRRLRHLSKLHAMASHRTVRTDITHRLRVRKQVPSRRHLLQQGPTVHRSLFRRREIQFTNNFVNNADSVRVFFPAIHLRRPVRPAAHLANHRHRIVANLTGHHRQLSRTFGRQQERNLDDSMIVNMILAGHGRLIVNGF